MYDIDINSIKSILLVRLSALGDCVCALPVYHALRKQFPHAHITWVIQENNAPLIQSLPGLNEIVLFPRKKLKKLPLPQKIQGLTHFRRQLQDRTYDLALDIQSNTKSSVIAWLSKTPKRIGHGKGEAKEISPWFNNITIPPLPHQQHIVLRNLHLLSALDIHTDTPDFSLPIPHEAKSSIDTWLQQVNFNHQKYVLIVPFCGRQEKEWPLQSYHSLIDAFEKHNIPNVILNTPGYEEITNTLISEKHQKSTLIALKTSIPEMIELIRSAALVIGGDTGPLQLAGALNIPSIAFFGPTNPQRHRPWSASHIMHLSDPPDTIVPKCFELLGI